MKMLWIFYPEGVGVNDSQIWWLHIFQMGEKKLPTGIEENKIVLAVGVFVWMNIHFAGWYGIESKARI